MTDIADQRADRVIEVTSPLTELRAVQKVYRAGKLEYVAVRGWTWRSGDAIRYG